MKFPCIYCSKMVTLEDMKLDEIECEHCNKTISLPLENNDEDEIKKPEPKETIEEIKKHPFRLYGTLIMIFTIIKMVGGTVMGTFEDTFKYPMNIMYFGFMFASVVLVIVGRSIDKHKEYNP